MRLVPSFSAVFLSNMTYRNGRMTGFWKIQDRENVVMGGLIVIAPGSPIFG